MSNKKEAINYLIFGVLSTIINIVVFYIFNSILDSGTIISNFIAWIFAVIFAFITNKFYVFDSRESSKSNLLREFLLFISARIISLGIDMVVIVVLIDYMGVNDIISKVLSNILVIIFNYFASKFLIFKKR